MNEFVVLNLILRRIVPAVATGLDRAFRLVGGVQRRTTPARNDIAGAGGVPAKRRMEIREPQATLSRSADHVEAESATHASIVTPLTASMPSPPRSTIVATGEPYSAPERQGRDDERQEDDLDWAGSLAHAAAASLHIGNILAMVRAGWLIPDAEQLAGITAALDAMDAFHARTDSVIAPVLAAMDEDQQADFFGDFDADLPADLPELDGA